jgi:hypothetical protein
MVGREDIPVLLIIAMGLADCVTTIIGVSYSGASEINPAMAGVINSSVGTFAIVKVAATMFIALTYLVARKVLIQLTNKDGKAYGYSMKGLTLAYFGLVGFLGVAVANNLLILIH